MNSHRRLDSITRLVEKPARSPRENQIRDIIRWGTPIALGVVFLAVIISLHGSARRIADRLAKVSDPAAKEQLTVVVTLDDSRYHLPECPRIRGDTREMTWRQAQDHEAQPCPYCFQEDWQEMQSEE